MKRKRKTTNSTYLADNTAIQHVFLDKSVFTRDHSLGNAADSEHFQTLSSNFRD